MSIIKKAIDFAREAHGDQKRKYTHEPYIGHPINVAMLVLNCTDSPNDVIAAGALHDVVEDTPITIEDIRKEFGIFIGGIVDGLTDVSKPGDGNRAARKAIDRRHLSKGSPEIQTIKLADLIDNTSSIVKYDPEFAKVYMAEKKLLLGVLIDGHPTLYTMAQAIVRKYYKGATL